MIEQPLFSELSAEDVELIARHGIAKNVPKNTVLISEGDKSDSFFVIRTGRVKVFLSDDGGKEVTLTTQGPGEYFGELALIDAEPRSASVIALESTDLAVVSKADFQRCLAENPQIALELIRSLSKRVRSLTSSVKNLALLDVYGRVAHTLLDLAEEDKNGELVVRQKMTHLDMAQRVGASREMVSRILKDLSTGGYIDIEKGCIYIRNKLPPGW